MYSAPYGMGHSSNTELNMTHFYTNPNFLLALWIDLAEMFQEQLEVLKKSTFGEVMWQRNIWPLMTQYIFTYLISKLNGTHVDAPFTRLNQRRLPTLTSARS